MDKQDITPLIDFIFEAKEKLKRERLDLLKEFEMEYPPQIGARGGYLLVGDKCGKKGCTECPHRLVWRNYSRREGRVIWGDRVDKLPRGFWNSRRDPELKERFRYFEQRKDYLNSAWKDLQRRLQGINTSLHKTVKWLIREE